MVQHSASRTSRSAVERLPMSSPLVARNSLVAWRPSVAQHVHEVPFGVELRGGAELGQHIGPDAMRPHLRPACALARSRIGHLAQQSDHAQFLHQRRIEGNLVEPIEDIRGRARRVRPFARIDLHQDGIVGVAFADQRRDGGIADEAAIPVGFAVDFDRPEHRRQTRRGEQDVGRDVRVSKDAATAGSHIRRGDEQLDRRTRQTFEVDALDKDVAQRIEAEWIEVVGRKHPRHQVHGDIGRRCIERPLAHETIQAASAAAG